jgi:hypothetical protein
MRELIIVIWLFIGLGAGIYHFGPGREKLEQDHVAALIREARDSVEQEDWSKAIEKFDLVLARLPEQRHADSLQIQLEQCKAQMMAQQLPTARDSLEQLYSDARNDPSLSQKFVADVQSTLANSQYYMAWLMRLEGLAEEEWLPEIESSRQHYAQLADDAEKRGDLALAKRSSEDLESAVRLARMDLGELQGLPLPNQ